MKYRNSSRNSMHLLNGVMVGGDDAHTAGVEIYPAASGSIPTIEAVADATTQTLRIAGKGSRGVIVGAAGGSPSRRGSQPVPDGGGMGAGARRPLP